MRIKKTIAAILTSVMMLSLAACGKDGSYGKIADILTATAKDYGAKVVDVDDPVDQSMAAEGFVIESDDKDSIANALKGFDTIVDVSAVQEITAYTQMTNNTIALCVVCKMDSEDKASDAVSAGAAAMGGSISGIDVKNYTYFNDEMGDGIMAYLFGCDEDCFVIYSVIGSSTGDTVDMLETFCDLTGFDNPVKQ